MHSKSGDVYCTLDGYSIGKQTGSDYYNQHKPAASTEGKVVDIIGMKDSDYDSSTCTVFESGATKCWGQNDWFNFVLYSSCSSTPFDFYDIAR